MLFLPAHAYAAAHPVTLLCSSWPPRRVAQGAGGHWGCAEPAAARGMDEVTTRHDITRYVRLWPCGLPQQRNPVSSSPPSPTSSPRDCDREWVDKSGQGGASRQTHTQTRSQSQSEVATEHATKADTWTHGQTSCWPRNTTCMAPCEAHVRDSEAAVLVGVRTVRTAVCHGESSVHYSAHVVLLDRVRLQWWPLHWLSIAPKQDEVAVCCAVLCCTALHSTVLHSWRMCMCRCVLGERFLSLYTLSHPSPPSALPPSLLCLSYLSFILSVTVEEGMELPGSYPVTLFFAHPLAWLTKWADLFIYLFGDASLSKHFETATDRLFWLLWRLRCLPISPVSLSLSCFMRGGDEWWRFCIPVLFDAALLWSRQLYSLRRYDFNFAFSSQYCAFFCSSMLQMGNQSKRSTLRVNSFL